MNLQECFIGLTQIESAASQMYQKFADSCSEQLKPVVDSFAQEEGKHQKIMMAFSRQEEFREIQLDPSLAAVLQKQREHLAQDGESLDLTAEKDFFRFALQLETNSVDIYTSCSSIFAADSAEYSRFEALIQEERKHMLFILNRLYELK